MLTTLLAAPPLAAGVCPQTFAFPFGPPSPNTHLPTGARSTF